MTKNFKIARKPGQESVAVPHTAPVVEVPTKLTPKKRVTTKPAPRDEVVQTTRKTIEVPEEYFYKVKMRALERRILEKELWAEVLSEYFNNHPTL